jgi:hypothetical protein
MGGLAACAGDSARAAVERPVRNEKPVDEIVVSTERFRFHIGARFDPRWVENADLSRAVLGAAMSSLLEEEDTTVPVLSRQLGITWPDTPLDYEVALEDTANVDPCDSTAPALLRRMEVSRTGEPPHTFFACVLRRSFVRLEGESSLYRALAASTPPDKSPDAGQDGSSRGASAVYACVVSFAIASLGVASTPPPKEARRIEAGLLDVCTVEELAWVSREWVARVREDERPDAFGARAARALLRAPITRQ